MVLAETTVALRVARPPAPEPAPERDAEAEVPGGVDRLPRNRFGQARILRVLVARELRRKLSSVWFYLVASGACLIAAMVGSGFVRGFATESVLVSRNPLAVVDAFVLAFLGAVLGLRLAAAMSWEREHGTLEVLLSGPVRWTTLVLSKFAVELVVLAVLLLLYSAYVAIGRPLGTAVVDAGGLAGLWLTAPLVLPLMGLGLLISACLGGVRLAVTAYILALGFLGAIEAATAWLNLQSPETMALSALYIRSALNAAGEWLFWLSPLAYLGDLFRVAAADMAVGPERSLAAAGLASGLIALSVLVAARRGVS